MSENDGHAGVLAIWNDCTPGAEDVYEHWYRSEHLAERVGIEGFVAGWRYLAVQGEPRYFTHYETRSPEVLASDAYLARVNDPTPLTQRVMSGIFVNMSRTVCERVLRVGGARGACAVVLRFEAAPVPGDAAEALTVLAADESVLRAELWRAHDVPAPAKAPSAEERLRGPDAGIAACALLDCATEDEARAVLDAARARLPGADQAGIYRLLCSLHRADRL